LLALTVTVHTARYKRIIATATMTDGIIGTGTLEKFAAAP
jgi:hypothetical protein